MTSSVSEMLAQAREMPYGAAQVALLEQAMAHADAQRLDDAAFEARMLATTSYIYSGEPARSFVTFSWCLTEHDRDPVRHRRWTHHLMWSFKAIVSAMTKFPEIPLARTYDVLDDMERRWRAGGHSPHAVYAHRHLVARHVGDARAAEDWFTRWSAAPRDELSDCVGCDPTTKAYWLRDQGRDEEAVALAEPVLAGRLSCTEQPQAIYTVLLLPYLRTGRLDAARDAHRRAYRAHRTQLADLSDIAEHVAFCALTGNDALGLEIVERHRDWLDRAPTPWAAMSFAAAASLVLRRLDATGHGSVRVRDTPVGALSEELARRALDLAARFDARNGTSHQSDRVRAVLAAEPVTAELRLVVPGSRLARPEPPPPPPPTPAAPAESTVDIPADAGAGEVLALAERTYHAGRVAEAFAIWAAFDARHAADPLTDHQKAMRLDGAGSRAAHDNDTAAAAAAWAEAADLYATAGDELRRQVVRGRLGMGLLREGRLDEGRAMIEESTAHVLAHGTPDLVARAHLRSAFAHATTGRPAEAVAATDAVLAHAGAAPDPRVAPQALALKAQALGQLGDVEAAAEAAGESRRRHRAAGPSDELAHACWLHGVALSQLGRGDEALAAFDEGLAQPCPPDLRRALLRQRAGILAQSERAAEAVDPLVEEIATLTAQGDHVAAAAARFELAVAYLNAGRPLDAAEIAEEALATFDAAGDQRVLAVRDLLVAVYEALGEHEALLAQLTALADAVRAAGDQEALGRASERAAETLDHLDRDATAAARFADAAAAYAAADLPIDAARARRRHATSLLWAGQPDAALAGLAEADAGAATLPDEPHAHWERAMLDYDAARLLGRLDHGDDAIRRAGAAADRFRDIGAATQAGWSGLLRADLLREAGRTAEAEVALRRAQTDLPADDEEGHARLRAALADLHGV